MGDIQTDQGESLELLYVPPSEFRRVIDAAGPAALKARAFAALARINTLYMIAGAWSGHIGTSFSSLEIMSWLFLNEIRDLDKGPAAADIFFSSKGHDAPALYSVLIGLGLLPADKLHQLRRLHGLPGHPHVETPFIQANTGSLGMGISKAKGMAIANRLAGDAAPHLRADRRRRAAGRAVLGIARVRRQSRPRRDRGHRGPQQDPVGHMGPGGQPSWRSRGQVPCVRVAREPRATATTSRRSSARSARSTLSRIVRR